RRERGGVYAVAGALIDGTGRSMCRSRISASNPNTSNLRLRLSVTSRPWSREQAMKRAAILSTLLISTALAAGVVEAPVGFDDQTNGMVDQATHDANRSAFDGVETIKDGLGPVYNAQSCRECHQNPVSGGGSQVSELRVGHTVRHRFQNPV